MIFKRCGRVGMQKNILNTLFLNEQPIFFKKASFKIICVKTISNCKIIITFPNSKFSNSITLIGKIRLRIIEKVSHLFKEMLPKIVYSIIFGRKLCSETVVLAAEIHAP